MNEQEFEGTLKCSVVNKKIQLLAKGRFGEVKFNFSTQQVLELIRILEHLVGQVEVACLVDRDEEEEIIL